MSRAKNLSTSVLILGVIAGTMILGGQAVSWATSVCHVPNTSTVFCTEAEGTETCADFGSESICVLQFDTFERNEFPDGPVLSSSGSTKEEARDCWRRKYCSWNSTNNECVSGSWGKFQKADRTVVSEVVCPTEE